VHQYRGRAQSSIVDSCQDGRACCLKWPCSRRASLDCFNVRVSDRDLARQLASELNSNETRQNVLGIACGCSALSTHAHLSVPVRPRRGANRALRKILRIWTGVQSGHLEISVTTFLGPLRLHPQVAHLVDLLSLEPHKLCIGKFCCTCVWVSMHISFNSQP